MFSKGNMWLDAPDLQTRSFTHDLVFCVALNDNCETCGYMCRYKIITLVALWPHFIANVDKKVSPHWPAVQFLRTLYYNSSVDEENNQHDIVSLNLETVQGMLYPKQVSIVVMCPEPKQSNGEHKQYS